MSTYRIDGIKYNPANWAGLDESERKACNRFAAKRERELNTITATPWTCDGGPFAGSTIELESTTDRSAPMTVGGWVGHYELATCPKHIEEHGVPLHPGDAPSVLKWFGTVGAAPVKTHGAGSASKAAPEVTGKGFDLLTGLLAELAEDPAERATSSPLGPRARYNIGRTSFFIAATPEATEKLRARLIKAKKWFSDKMVNAAGPGRTIEAIPDIAAAMAATLAIAQAQASAATATPTAHQADTAEACGELVTCDGPDGADTAEATPCADTPADLAQATPEAHTPAADEPDHYTDPLKTCAQARDYTGPLKTQATVGAAVGQTFYIRGDLSQYTGNTKIIHGGVFHEYTPLEGHEAGKLKYTQKAPAPTPFTAMENSASEAPALPEVAAEPSDNTPPKNGTGFAQQASSKVGAWVAALYRDTQGAHVLRFDVAGMNPAFSVHASRSEMMASLQAMARQADQAQAHTPADPAPAAPEVHTPRADEPGHYTGPLKTQEQAPDYTEALKTQQQSDTLEQEPAVVGFARAKPFSLDPRELLSAGLKVDQLVGLGVLYLGNAANASGEGAITEVNDTRGQSFGGLNMVCTLEDGRVIDAEPWSFTGDLRPIFQFNGKMHGAPYLAQLAAVRASLKAQHSSAQAMAEAEHARQLETLAAEFPQLERPGKNSAGKLVAINVRKLLKAAFKDVKFSVTSDYNACRVGWSDGPTTEQVNAVIGRFDIGHSDCQTDYFYTKETAWSELFGGVQYLTTSRTLSAATIGPVLLSLYGENGPTFEQWRTGKRWDEVAHGNGPWSNAYDNNPNQDPWSWLSHVRRVANGKTQ